MVNLIITLISIALIAIIAVATLYNGGDAFRSGSAQASAAQLTNGAQQISAANILYANMEGMGSYTDEISTLTTDGKYLSSAPQSPADDFVLGAGNVITAGGLSDEVCEAVNEQAGTNGIFSCDTDTNVYTFN